MKFIKLTVQAADISIYVNIDRVSCLMLHPLGTKIWQSGSDKDEIFVKESPEEIMQLIEEKSLHLQS